MFPKVISELTPKRYILYAAMAMAGVVVGAEAFYQCVRFFYGEKDETAKKGQLCDVLWTNPSTRNHVCGATKMKGKAEPEDLKVENIRDYVKKKCSNEYCFIRNIAYLVKLIDCSKYTIDLAMYTFTLEEIFNALLRAKERGVIVRVICDKEMSTSTGSKMGTLIKMGVIFRYPDNTALMHHKVCIFDGPMSATAELAKEGKKYDHSMVRGIVLTGSMNWTLQAFSGNFENMLICDNEEVVKEYETEFQYLWNTFQC